MTVAVHLGACCECGQPTDAHDLICATCKPLYADPPACDCVPCVAGMKHIAGCAKEQGRG